MSKVSLIKTSFNAGELSPRLDGRIDIDKYSNGCSILENFIPLVQGGIMKRPGTQYISSTKNNQKVWLAKFEFNYQQSFVLEFGPLYIRFYFNHGQLLNGSVPYEVTTPYTADDLTTVEGTFGLSTAQTGDVIYLANRNHPPAKLSRFGNTNWVYSIVDFKEGPFEENNKDKTANVAVSGLKTFIGINFAEYTVTLNANANIFTTSMVGTLLQFEVIDDPVIKPWYSQITSPSGKVTNIGDIVRNDGKYYGANQVVGNKKTWYVAPTHTEGGRWDGDEVSWWYLADQIGIIKITNISSSIVATGTVIRQVANTGNTTNILKDITVPVGVTITLTSATDMNLSNNPYTGIIGSPANILNSISTITITGNMIPNYTSGGTISDYAISWAWSKSAWRSDIGYPDQVVFFSERLVFARDQQVWFSKSGDYENFAAKDYGEVQTDSAIRFDITSEDSSPIKYMVTTPQGLICGTNADQVLITAASLAQPFGPDNIRVSPGSGIGGKQINPVKIDQSILVVQRSGRKIMNTQYDATNDFFNSPDQTVIADHILESGVNNIAWQHDPWNILWMVRSDGQLVGFTFNQQQEVQGFHRHITDGFIEAVQVIPSPDGSRDDLWMVVKRTINGNTVRYVEILKSEYNTGDDQTTCWYSDSALQYKGTAVSTISGLDHLIGKTVQVLANGAMHPNRVVAANGTIMLDFAATTVIAGLPYTATVQTMHLEGGTNNGTSQGKMKRIDRIIIRLLNSMGSIQCAPSVTGNQSGKFDIITFHSTNDRLDLPPAIFTGDMIVDLSSEYNRVGRICIKQTESFPLNILAIMSDMNTNER